MISRLAIALMLLAATASARPGARAAPPRAADGGAGGAPAAFQLDVCRRSSSGGAPTMVLTVSDEVRPRGRGVGPGIRWAPAPRWSHSAPQRTGP
jgi:hypothetical protein